VKDPLFDGPSANIFNELAAQSFKKIFQMRHRKILPPLKSKMSKQKKSDPSQKYMVNLSVICLITMKKAHWKM